MVLVRHLLCLTVRSIGMSHPPGDKAPIHGPTCRSTALPRNGRQLSRVRFFALIQVRQSRHECGVSGRTRGQPRSRWEGVVARHMDKVIGPFTVRHGLGLIDTRSEALVLGNVLDFCAIEPQAVASEASRGSDCRDGPQIALVESDGNGRVDGSVVSCVSFAPVLDAGNVGRG